VICLVSVHCQHQNDLLSVGSLSTPLSFALCLFTINTHLICFCSFTFNTNLILLSVGTLSTLTSHRTQTFLHYVNLCILLNKRASSFFQVLRASLLLLLKKEKFPSFMDTMFITVFTTARYWSLS